jgi:hypothetical protein
MGTAPKKPAKKNICTICLKNSDHVLAIQASQTGHNVGGGELGGCGLQHGNELKK